jgi:hypothetical protein
MGHTFGVPGIVKRVAVQDTEWKPTVGKGGYSGNPEEIELGRRTEVDWLKKGVPPLDEVAVMPEGIRNSTGEVRATIEPIRSKRYARFMEIIGDHSNWEKYASEKLASPVETAIRDRDVAGSGVASFLAGHTPYLVRAREEFTILVRLAHARQTIFYSDLAGELNMPNPRNLNYFLGAIGKAIQKLAVKLRLTT